MFEAWGRFVFRRRRLVLADRGSSAVVAAAVWGTGVFGALQSAGGFAPPHSQSQQEADLAARTFGRTRATSCWSTASHDQTVHSRRVPVGRDTLAGQAAAQPGHGGRRPTGRPARAQFASADGRVTLRACCELAGGSDTARIANYQRDRRRLRRARADRAGGRSDPDRGGHQQAGHQRHRPGRGHLDAGPAGPARWSSSAASRPPACRWPSAASASSARSPRLRLLTLATPVSIYSVNVTTILGPRARHRLRPVHGRPVPRGTAAGSPRSRTRWRGPSRRQAARSRSRASPSPMALASLLLFPEVFLRSMGYGGVATVLVDMLAALTVLPALLAVLGPQGERAAGAQVRAGAAIAGSCRRLVPAGAQRDAPAGRVRRRRSSRCCSRSARRSCKSPGAAPTHARLPAAAAPRVVTQTLARDFPGNVTAPIEALVTFAAVPIRHSSPARQAQLAAYARPAQPGPRRHRRAGHRRTRRRRQDRPAATVPTRCRRRPGRSCSASATSPRPPGASGLHRRPDRAARRRARQPLGDGAVDGAGDGCRDVRAAVPGVRLGRPAGQGDRR